MHTPCNAGRRRWLLAGAAATVAGVTGCGGGLDDHVRLRAVNATVDVAGLDVDYNGWTFAFDVRRGGEASGYGQRSLLAVGGFGSFEVFQSSRGRRLLSESHSLPDGDSASVVLMGYGNDMKLRLVDEDAGPPAVANQVRLRVLHAVPGLGAVDVHLSAADAALAGRSPSWTLDRYDELSGYVEGLASGRLRVTRRGDPSALLFDNRGFTLPGGSAATLVLAPSLASGGLVATVLPQGEPARVLADIRS